MKFAKNINTTAIVMLECTEKVETIGYGVRKLVVVAAGGTGGHVFPALCVARELSSPDISVVFATDQRGQQYLEEFKSTAVIQCISTSSKFFLYVSVLLSLCLAAVYLLRKRVNLVIGFGGYPSVPFVLAAQLLGIKTIIHEQNAVVGKANKLLTKMSTKVITSFGAVQNLSRTKNVFFVGNPTRYEQEYTSKKHSNNRIFTILVFGGSQGAKFFSEDIVSAICETAKTFSIKVIQQARQEDIQKIQNAYDAYGVDCLISTFFDTIDTMYKKSNLVVSRSGASSIFEIIGFQKPAILIPYPKSTNGDQMENAKFLEKHGAAIVIGEADISVERLKQVIQHLIEDETSRYIMSKNLKKLYIKDTTKKFAQIVHKTLYNQHE
ncbi:MAG: undecaprenyldiphospho-muramoylpentapeptide beta-N-acetylglucosaminyltransferase [Holosporales bacterium]|nr:undecaprenyldiphospho-muramoylpentapeptide beta-N-acetylglucosaminyltransferase [Holosporales bacterium]